MSQLLSSSDTLSFTSKDDSVKGSSDDQSALKCSRESSQNGKMLDSGQQRSPDGTVSQDEMESLQDVLSINHGESLAERDGQLPVLQDQKGHSGSVFQSQEAKPDFVDQTLPQNKQLSSFVSQGSSSQDNPLKSKCATLFQGHVQTLPETRSSLQEELEALSSFNVPIKRTELTLQEKVDLLNHSEGKSQRQLAQMFGIGKCQVHTILKRRPEILKAYKQNCVSDRKRFGKRPQNDDVNRFTWEWFQEMSKTQGIQMNGAMLQEQAKEFAKQLGRNEFKASKGWLICFRKRHNIQSSEQGLSTQESPITSSWKNNLKTTMSEYSYKDILCLTEVHLNYAALPEKVKAACGKRKGDNLDHSLTVMLWYNMLGDFDTPVVIGRHPWQTHCNVEEADMPVIWRWNSNAWVAADIFQEWIRALDRKFQQQGRHVLLFLEHTSVHILDLHLEHVKCIFHPSNSLEASPFNSVVIQRFKFCYQKQLLQFIVPQLDAQQENVMAIAGSVSLPECCVWISQAVGQVHPSIVKRAFSTSLPDHVFLADLEESDDNTESTESEAQSGYSVEEELEFQTLVGIVLSSLYSNLGSGLDGDVNSNSGLSSTLGKSDSKMKRVELTLQKKVELLRIHQQNGKSQRHLAKMFGISKGQIRFILKRKDEILDHYENNANLGRKRICCRAENDNVNRLTLKWYNKVSKLVDIPITGIMVQEKAKRIAAEIGRSDFKASNGWLDSFRKRNNIDFLSPKSTSASEEHLEEISLRPPSSCNNSLDNPLSGPDNHSLSAGAIHRKSLLSSELDFQGTIKEEPEDVSEKLGCSESVSRPGDCKTRLPDSDDDEDSDSNKSRTDATQTPCTSISDITNKCGKEKTDLTDKKTVSQLERSSIRTFLEAAVMARELRLFCEDKNLTQLSAILDFVEKQLQIHHMDIS